MSKTRADREHDSFDLDGDENPYKKVDSSNFTLAIEYDANENPVYIGEASIGTAKSATGWRIKKLTFDANDNLTDLKWADGVRAFTKVWDDRADYTYG